MILDALNKAITFLANAWRFRRELREWGPWDYECSYALFARSLELQKEEIEAGKRHESWEEDASEIGYLLDRWHTFLDTADPDEQDRAWFLFHSVLKSKARGWWC